MIVLKTEEFVIDELIKVEGKETYEFKMQLTGEETKEVEKLILNEEAAKLNKKMTNETDKLKKEELESKYIKLINKTQNRFEEICFKEHMPILKETLNEYNYDKIVEAVFDFFWKTFIGEKTKRANTMNSDLHKIGGK